MNRIIIMLLCFCGTVSAADYSKMSGMKGKHADAEIKTFKMISRDKAEVVLDFINIFSTGVESEYQRYLKAGYPKISREKFDEQGPGGVAIFNTNPKLRTLYTTPETIYEAHCVETPNADKDGKVKLTLNEFASVLGSQYVDQAITKARHDKFGNCYSQNGTVVYITYLANHIESIGFHWMP